MITIIYLQVQLIIVASLETCLANLPWDKWSWSMPQGPIEHFFRRKQDIPIKIPECECPPHEECKLEYKINEDMAEFLHLRGILKEEDLKNFNDYLKNTTKEPTETQHGSRRFNSEAACCCPPISVMMPTFITDNKFNEVVKRIEEQNSSMPDAQ